MLLKEFDGGSAIIEPSATHAPLDGMPETCIGVFSHLMVEEWLARHGGEVLLEITSVARNRPVHRITHGGREFALWVPPVGGPAAGADMEQLIAHGARRFVFLGCCGVLRHDIADGHLILPTAALRDEGFSFHYLPPADEVELDPALVALAGQVMADLGLPFVEGKTWTTDALFRETPAKMEKAKAMGAVCVEMECACLAAMARFRGVPFVQFLWGADNLDAPEWDSRGLYTKGASVAEKCMAAALEIAGRLAD